MLPDASVYINRLLFEIDTLSHVYGYISGYALYRKFSFLKNIHSSLKLMKVN